MKFFKVPFFVAFAFQVLPVYAYSDQKEFVSKDIQSVVVKNQSGNVEIHSTTTQLSTVSFQKNKFSDKCRMILKQENNELVIKVENQSLISDECNVDFEISVPKMVDLKLHSGSGNFKIKDINGKLNFKIGSGNLNATGDFRKVDGKIGSGNIDINGLNNGGDLKSGSGNINVRFVPTVQNGELEIRTGSGDATLFYPKTANLDIDFKAGSGKLTSELPSHLNGKFKVDMRAGSGDLNIKSF